MFVAFNQGHEDLDGLLLGTSRAIWLLADELCDPPQPNLGNLRNCGRVR
jgi:hypothetical protein